MALRLLKMDEAGVILRKSQAQMRWLRHTGSGPRSANIAGRVMYREQDVLDWIDAQFEADEALRPAS